MKRSAKFGGGKAKKARLNPAKSGKKRLLSKPIRRKAEPKDELDVEDEVVEETVSDNEDDSENENGEWQGRVEDRDEDSEIQLQTTKLQSEDATEVKDEASDESAQLKEDEKEGIAPFDTFYERFVKKTTEEAIKAQIKAYDKVAKTNLGVVHKLLGGVIGSGPAAVGGLPGAVGLVEKGIENTEWLNNDSHPTDLSSLGIRNKFLTAFAAHPSTSSDPSSVDGFTPLQLALSSLLMSYSDIAYHSETYQNHQQIMQCYALHAINHVYRSRMVSYRNSLHRKADPSAEISDQGFTRPRVLILTPLRNTAYDVVKFMTSILNSEILHKDKFEKKFSPSGRKAADKTKPSDYQHYFRGNVDDMFTLGIMLKNDTSVSLDNTNLYHSDIIVASPVAIRMLIGEEGDKKRNFDFLSSVDVVIVDQMEVMLMQNWTYLTTLFDHLNVKPAAVRPGMDFSRTNEWSLSNLSAHRRQTVFFSAYSAPDINGLFSRKCNRGVIERVIPQLRQTFQRLECEGSLADLDDNRFKLFVDEIFPHLSSTLPSRIVLFIPSYFDFLRIKELFLKEREPFCQANEYMKPHKIVSQCKNFAKNNVKWLLCTERCYFYNRPVIPRIRHVVFYSPPWQGGYYNELLNSIVSNDGSSLVLYTRFDKLALQRVAGHSRADKMIASNKSTFMFR